jgi:hypothetical protein
MSVSSEADPQGGQGSAWAAGVAAQRGGPGQLERQAGERVDGHRPPPVGERWQEAVITPNEEYLLKDTWIGHYEVLPRPG